METPHTDKRQTFPFLTTVLSQPWMQAQYCKMEHFRYHFHVQEKHAKQISQINAGKEHVTRKKMVAMPFLFESKLLEVNP
jgi:hypothetical protein